MGFLDGLLKSWQDSAAKAAQTEDEEKRKKQQAGMQAINDIAKWFTDNTSKMNTSPAAGKSAKSPFELMNPSMPASSDDAAYNTAVKNILGIDTPNLPVTNKNGTPGTQKVVGNSPLLTLNESSVTGNRNGWGYGSGDAVDDDMAREWDALLDPTSSVSKSMKPQDRVKKINDEVPAWYVNAHRQGTKASARKNVGTKYMLAEDGNVALGTRDNVRTNVAGLYDQRETGRFDYQKDPWGNLADPSLYSDDYLRDQIDYYNDQTAAKKAKTEGAIHGVEDINEAMAWSFEPGSRDFEHDTTPVSDFELEGYAKWIEGSEFDPSSMTPEEREAMASRYLEWGKDDGVLKLQEKLNNQRTGHESTYVENAGVSDAYENWLDKLNKEQTFRFDYGHMRDEAQRDPNFTVNATYDGPISGNDFASRLYNALNDPMERIRFDLPYENGGAASPITAEGYDLMTPKEMQLFNWYAKQGRGQEFLDIMKNTLQHRNAEAMSLVTQYYATKNAGTGLLTWGVARMANLGAAMQYPFQAANALLGGETDAASSLYAANRYVNDVSEAQTQAIANSNFLKIPGMDGSMDYRTWLYSAATSAADSLIGVGVGTTLGGGAGTKLGKVLANLIMSSTAASHALEENLRSGMDPTHAFFTSLADGAAEAITETWSIESLLSDPTHFMSYLAKNVFSEASEEGASSILQAIGDRLINGDNSQMANDVDVLVLLGMSPEEAQKRVLSDWLNETLQGMAIGGISGGMSAGGWSISNAIGEASAGRQINKGIFDRAQRSFLRGQNRAINGGYTPTNVNNVSEQNQQDQQVPNELPPFMPVEEGEGEGNRRAPAEPVKSPYERQQDADGTSRTDNVNPQADADDQRRAPAEPVKSPYERQQDADGTPRADNANPQADAGDQRRAPTEPVKRPYERQQDADSTPRADNVNPQAEAGDQRRAPETPDKAPVQREQDTVPPAQTGNVNGQTDNANGNVDNRRAPTQPIQQSARSQEAEQMQAANQNAGQPADKKTAGKPKTLKPTKESREHGARAVFETQQKVADIGAGLAEGSEARKTAEAALEQLKKGKRLSNRRTYQLYSQVYNQLDEDLAAPIKSAARQDIEFQLTKDGVEQDEARHAARSLADILTGNIDNVSDEDLNDILTRKQTRDILHDFGFDSAQMNRKILSMAGNNPIIDFQLRRAAYDRPSNRQTLDSWSTMRQIMEGRYAYSPDSGEAGKQAGSQERQEYRPTGTKEQVTFSDENGNDVIGTIVKITTRAVGKKAEAELAKKAGTQPAGQQTADQTKQGQPAGQQTAGQTKQGQPAGQQTAGQTKRGQPEGSTGSMDGLSDEAKAAWNQMQADRNGGPKEVKVESKAGPTMEEFHKNMRSQLSARMGEDNIESVNDVVLTVRDGDGNTREISVDDVTGASSDGVQAILEYAMATPEILGTNKLNLMYQWYQGEQPTEYMAAFNHVYNAGFSGYVMDPSTVDALGSSRAEFIYEAGRQAAQEAEKIRQENIKHVGKGKGTLTIQGIDNDDANAVKAYLATLDNNQRASYEALKPMAKATGVNIVLFRSQADANGRITSENGHYDPYTNSLYLDLNAGLSATAEEYAAQGMPVPHYAILRTAGHELTHFIENSSADGYARLRAYVENELLRNGTKTFEDLIEDKMDRYARAGNPLTREGAISEVIADSMEMILQDSKAIERMANQDKSVFQRIRDFLHDFADNVRKAFTGVEAGSWEAQLLLQDDEGNPVRYAEKLVKLWDDALMEASAANAVADQTEAQQSVGVLAPSADEDQTISGDRTGFIEMPKDRVQDSVRTYLDMEPKAIGPAFLKNHNIPYEVHSTGIKGRRTVYASGRDITRAILLENGFGKQTDEVLSFMDNIADYMKDAEVQYHYVGLTDVNSATATIDPDSGKILLSCKIKNDEYEVNFDLGTVCKKRQALQNLFNELAARNGKTGATKLDDIELTSEHIFRINEILRDNGYETACLGCFVEARRYKTKAWADRVVGEWNAEVLKQNPNAGYFDFARGRTDIDKMSAAEKKAHYDALNAYSSKGTSGPRDRMKRLAKIPTMQKLLRASDLISEQGRDRLRKFSSTLDSIAQSRDGANAIKPTIGFIPYNSEMALLPATKTKHGKRMTMAQYLKSIGGARSQSFTDFIVTQAFDHLQKTVDMAARKVTAHTYTKELGRAWLFGMTGEKINMSVLFDIDPKQGWQNAGLDANGEYIVGDYVNAQKQFEKTGKRAFTQSIPFKQAVELEHNPLYSKNVGIIGVGYSYNHMKKMLSDENIPYIIMYHRSGMPQEVATAANIAMTTDYTPVQNTQRFLGFRTVMGDGHGVPSYASWGQLSQKKTGASKMTYNSGENGLSLKQLLADHNGDPIAAMNDLLSWMDQNKLTMNTSTKAAGHGDFDLYGSLNRTMDPTTTANEYIKWCLQNEMLPLGWEFCTDPGYYKILYDYSVTDLATGETATQQPVTMDKMLEIGPEQWKAGTDGVHGLDHFMAAYDRTLERDQSVFEQTLNQVYDELAEGQSEAASQGPVDVGDAGNRVAAKQYELREYDEVEKQRLSASKSIVLYESKQQYRDFISEAVADPTAHKRMYFGKISQELAEAIEKATGVKTEGYNLIVGGDEINKVLKKHGKPKEALSGQIAITPEDFEDVPQIITSPDMIIKSDKLYNGDVAILFIKLLKGRTTIVSYVSNKKHGLRLQTMYRNKNNSLATVLDEQSPNLTSEAARGTAINDRVPLSERNVNGDRAENNIQRSIRSQEADADYMEAVNNGDTSTADRMVRQAAYDWGAYQKPDGGMYFYHGTNADFNRFDPDKIGSSGAGSYMGYGFNFAADESMAEGYGSNLKKVFLKIKNPLLPTRKTITAVKLAKVIQQMENYQPADFDGDTWTNSIVWNYDSNMPSFRAGAYEKRNAYMQATRNVARMIVSNAESDADIYSEISSSGAAEVASVISAFQNLGYDSVLHNNSDGDKLRAAIVFSPSQIKSAETVTRDDDGNVIPLSQRFDTASEDIRYSLRLEPMTTTREYIMGLTDDDLQTEAERAVLAKYRQKVTEYGTAAAAREKYENDLLNYNGQDQNELTKLNNRAQLARDRLNRVQAELEQIEKSNAFVRIAADARQAMSVIQSVAGSGNVDRYLETMRTRLANAQSRMDDILKDLEGWPKPTEGTTARMVFGKNQLSQKVSDLMKANPSTLSKDEVTDSLAHIALLYNIGDTQAIEDANREVEELARKLQLQKNESIESYELTQMADAIGAFSLNDNQKKEVKRVFGSINNFKKALQGYGRYDPKATNLDANWNEMVELTGNQLDANIGDAQEPIALVDYISRTVQSAQEATALSPEDAQNELIEIQTEILTAATDLQAAIPMSRETLTAIQDLVKTFGKRADKLEQQLVQLVYDADHARANADLAQATYTANGGRIIKGVDAIRSYYSQVADQYTKEILLQKETELRDKYANIMRIMRTNAAQRLQEQAANYRQQIKDVRELRDISQKIRTARNVVRRQIMRVNKLLLQETNSKNVPEGLKGMAEALVTAFARADQNGRGIILSEEEANNLILEYSYLMRRDGDLDSYAYDPDVLEQLRTIKDQLDEYRMASIGQSYYDLNNQRKRLAICQNIAGTVNDLVSLITSANYAFIDGKKVEVGAAADRMAVPMLSMKDYGRPTGGLGRMASNVDEFTRWGNMTPYYFKRQIDNAGFTPLMDDLEQAEHRWGLQMQSAHDRINEMRENYHAADWGDDKLSLPVKGGGTVEITRGQAMSILAIWQREHHDKYFQSHHLEEGGFVLAEDGGKLGKGLLGLDRNAVGRTRGSRITLVEIQAISDWLTDEQKAYMQEMISYLSNEMSDIGNETSMKLYGIKKYKEKHYFPIQSYRGALTMKSDAGAASTTNDSRIEHVGFSNARLRNANNTILIDDFSKVAAGHVQQMLMYANFAPTIEALNKVLNAQFEFEDGEKMRIRQMFENKYGKNAKDYLQDYIKALNGGVNPDRQEAFWGKLTSMFKKTAVVGSLSVAAKQPMSIIRAAAMINPRYLAAAAAKNLTTMHGQKSFDEARKYAGTAVIKDIGKFDTGVGMSNVDWLLERDGQDYDLWTKAKEALNPRDWETWKARWNDILGFLPSRGDSVTWGAMWEAVKLEQHALHPSMNQYSQEFLQMCGERFNTVMRATQVYDSTIAKAPNIRSTSTAMKTITAFMNEPVLTVNMLYDSIRNAKKTGMKDHINPATAGACVIVSAIAQAFITSLFSAIRSDDKEKTIAEKMAGTFGQNLQGEINPLNMIPGVKDIVDILEGGTLERTEFSALTEVVTKMGKAWNGQYAITDLRSGYKFVEDIAGGVAKLFGVPVKNIMREVRSVWNIFTQPDRATNPTVFRMSLTEGLHVLPDKFLGFTLVDTSTQAYVERMYKALRSGDTKAAADYREYLIDGKGVKEGSIKSKIKSLLYADYAAERIGIDEAIQFGMEQELWKKEKDAYSALIQAADKAEHSGEDEYKTSAYVKVYDALLAGDKAAYNAAVKDMAGHGYTDKAVQSEAKSQIGKWYKEGELTQTQATSMLAMLGITAKNDVYWTLDAWDYQAENGDSTGYTKYDDFLEAVETGRGLQAAIQAQVQHSDRTEKEVKSTLASQITSKYKDQYVQLVRAGRTGEAANLQARLLTAYEALGYNRAKKLKDIQKWVK